MAAFGGSVARRYAKALFGIGIDRGTYDQLGAELAALTKLLEGSSELRQALENPGFKGSEKRAILKSLLPRVAPSEPVQRFALLLLERGRIGALSSIGRAYREMADARAGQVRASVTSATPLGASEVDKVRRSLEQRTGQKVIVETSVDPSLIGGVVARVGDLVLDGSVRTQLDELRRRLLN